MTATDLTQARILGAQTYYPHSLSFVRAAGEADLHMRLQAGDLTPEVTVGKLGYRAAVRLDCGQLESGYQINIPLSGTALSRCGAQTTLATSRQAAVFTPDVTSSIELWSPDCVQLGVRLASTLVDELLSEVTFRPVRGPIRFTHSYDLLDEARRAWVRLVDTALDLMMSLPLEGREHAGKQLARSVAVGFLYSADHELRDVLETVGPRPATKVLRRAIQAIEESPADPLDIAALATLCGVSVRTLQYEFSRHLGVSPSAYRRQVALDHAHHDLLAADPGRDTVADIACRWGFFHLGRFARDHQLRYGTRPVDALKSGSD